MATRGTDRAAAECRRVWAAVSALSCHGSTRLRGLTEPGAEAAGRVRVDGGATPARRLGRREGVADLSTVFRDREIISG